MILGGLAIAAFTAGWFQIHREGEHTMIRIDGPAIREDASRVIDRGRDFLERRQMEQQARQDADFGAAGYDRDDALTGYPDGRSPSTAGADGGSDRYGRPQTYGYGRPTGYRSEAGYDSAPPTYRDRGENSQRNDRGVDAYPMSRQEARFATEPSREESFNRDEIGYRENLRYSTPRR